VIGQGLDYSARRIGGRAIKEAGYDFVVRYLWFPGQRVSYVDAYERADLVAAGVDVHLVYEQTTADPAGGWDAGVRMARQAVQSAREIGAPPGTVIFFCADAWLSAHGIPVPTAMAFLDGARSAIAEYTPGAYGFADFVFAAAAGGHADRFWLCGAEIPDEHRPPWLHLYQWNNGRVHVDGVECDLNKLYRPLSSAPGSGGGGGEGEHDMPIVVKSPDNDAMYAVTSDGQDFMKRHINGLEAALLEKAGVPTHVLPQDQVDAIPSMWDGLTHQLSQALSAKVDDAVRRLAALEERPVADVDEAALAEELAARGLGGTDPVVVKAALAEVLRRSRLTVDEVQS
jgi:hypothetical protein